jgi:hypothetical protein
MEKCARVDNYYKEQFKNNCQEKKYNRIKKNRIPTESPRRQN